MTRMIVTYRIDMLLAIRTRQYLSHLDTPLQVLSSIVHLVIKMLVELPIFSESAQHAVFVLLIFSGNNRSVAGCRSVLQYLGFRLQVSLHRSIRDAQNLISMITTQFNNS